MIVAVVPARGGSKGVPRKNLRDLCGRPLLAWSIQAAQGAAAVERVIVSTDDDEIAAAAARYGADVLRRPAEAASDTAPIEAALWSVHQQIEGAYEWMVTLQPTCPVRRPRLVDDCVRRVRELDADAVFTAAPVPRCWLWEETTGAEWAEFQHWRRLSRPQQRQEIGSAGRFWQHDGSVCVSHRSLIDGSRGYRDRIGGRAFPLANDGGVDIDTEADLIMADALLRHMRPVAA